MQIPLLYADAVIGTNGATISYIRRASGATVTIQESRGAPGEMTVEINGTASQVQAAQQLIQVTLGLVTESVHSFPSVEESQTSQLVLMYLIVAATCLYMYSVCSFNIICLDLLGETY